MFYVRKEKCCQKRKHITTAHGGNIFFTNSPNKKKIIGNMSDHWTHVIIANIKTGRINHEPSSFYWYRWTIQQFDRKIIYLAFHQRMLMIHRLNRILSKELCHLWHFTTTPPIYIDLAALDPLQFVYSEGETIAERIL